MKLQRVIRPLFDARRAGKVARKRDEFAKGKELSTHEVPKDSSAISPCWLRSRGLKRFRRILFNTLTAISLILALATAGLWVRSYWVREYICYRPARSVVGQTSVSVAYKLDWSRGTFMAMEQTVVRLLPEAGGEPEAKLPRLGWRFESDRGHIPLAGWKPNWISSPPTGAATATSNPTGHRVLYIHAIYPLLLSLLLPLSWLILRVASHRRVTTGKCVHCGYDIRANPAKCSECGHEITPPTTAVSK